MEYKNTAVVLAAGRGKRMGTCVHKQYLLLKGKPILYYSLKTFEDSPYIANIILVVGNGEIDYCREEIVEKYKLKKISEIIEGGTERYFSVHNGLQTIRECDFVFIHDGARPFVTGDIIERCFKTVKKYSACVVGMPAKDTVKLADVNGFAESTPNRNFVWIIQTPQVFAFHMVKEAYEKLIESEEFTVTDDAMVVERIMNKKVKFVEGSYQNIKITTPEDIKIAEAFLEM